MFKARILIVEDAAFMRAQLKDMIESGGYEIIAQAANGTEAVHLFKQYRPDLVTMDITMPEMSGIAALEEIMKFDPLARVIMCSAVGQQNFVIASIQAGAKDFIVKPLQRDRILSAIAKALQGLTEKVN